MKNRLHNKETIQKRTVQRKLDKEKTILYKKKTIQRRITWKRN